MNIKTIIKNEADKLAVDLDISSEELSSIAFHKILNMPYFGNTYKFIQLGLNEFDEISVGHRELSNIKYASSQKIEKTCIDFSKEKGSRYNQESLVTPYQNQEERNLLIEYQEIVKNSPNIKSLIESLEKRSEQDSVFYEKATAFLPNDFYDKDSLYALERNLLKVSNSEEFEKLEEITKKSYYRSSYGFDSLFVRDLFSYELNELIKLDNNALQERVTDLDLRTLFISIEREVMNLDNWNSLEKHEKEKIWKNIEKNETLYNKTVIKYLLENDNAQDKVYALIDAGYYTMCKENTLNKINNILKDPLIDTLTLQYKNQLDSIIGKVLDSYPMLIDNKSNFKFTIFEDNSIDHKVRNKLIRFLKTKDNLSIYNNIIDWEYAVKGLNVSQDYDDNLNSKFINIYMSNEIEVFGYCRGNRYQENKTKKLDSLMLHDIKIKDSNLTNDKLIVQPINKLLEIAKNENRIFTYDFFHTPNSEEKIAIKHIDDMKTKNIDIIFFNVGYKESNKEKIEYELQSKMFTKHQEDNIDFKEILKINQKIVKLITSNVMNDVIEKFEKIDRFDYNKKEEFISNLFNEIYQDKNIKMKNNKVKV